MITALINKATECELRGVSKFTWLSLDKSTPLPSNDKEELGSYVYDNLWTPCKDYFHKYGYPISVKTLDQVTTRTISQKQNINNLTLDYTNLLISFKFGFQNSKGHSKFTFSKFKPQTATILPIALDKYLKNQSLFELNSQIKLSLLSDLSEDILNNYYYWTNTNNPYIHNSINNQEKSLFDFIKGNGFIKDECLIFNCALGKKNYGLLVTYIPNSDFNKLGFNIFTL